MSTVHGARLPACMGGWCHVRDHCARFHQIADRDAPAERLCEPGWRSLFIQVGQRADRYVISVPAAAPVPQLPCAA